MYQKCDRFSKLLVFKMKEKRIRVITGDASFASKIDQTGMTLIVYKISLILQMMDNHDCQFKKCLYTVIIAQGPDLPPPLNSGRCRYLSYSNGAMNFLPPFSWFTCWIMVPGIDSMSFLYSQFYTTIYTLSFTFPKSVIAMVSSFLACSLAWVLITTLVIFFPSYQLKQQKLYHICLPHCQEILDMCWLVLYSSRMAHYT